MTSVYGLIITAGWMFLFLVKIYMVRGLVPSSEFKITARSRSRDPHPSFFFRILFYPVTRYSGYEKTVYGRRKAGVAGLQPAYDFT